MIEVDRRVVLHFDPLIPALVAPLIVLSLFLVWEANDALIYKQLLYVSAGIGAFVFFSLVPIRRLLWLIPIAYWVNILLLLSVKFFGKSILGAKRWLEIPIVNLTIQPSELIKPAFLLMIAYVIYKNPPPEEGYDWKMFFKLSFYVGLPFVLIAIEPDLGSAMVVAIVGAGILFLAGVRWKIWVTLIAVLAISSVFIFENLRDYQKRRILDFVGEKPSYHVQQSIIAIGSGGFFGQDKDDATQVQLKFLPIATTDFIFAYHVERFGFFGAIVLIAIYAFLILHLLSLRDKFKNDPLGQSFASGVACLLFVYMGINIAMVTGLAPVVGIPLPLVSHGGSSFMTFMICFGILENLLAFRFHFLYNRVTIKKRKTGA